MRTKLITTLTLGTIFLLGSIESFSQRILFLKNWKEVMVDSVRVQNHGGDPDSYRSRVTIESATCDSVFSPVKGFVSRMINIDGTWCVVLQTADEYTLWLSLLYSPVVHKGQSVEAGEFIGRISNGEPDQWRILDILVIRDKIKLSKHEALQYLRSMAKQNDRGTP